MPFVKGQTGNPNGRPLKTDDEKFVLEQCRKMSPTALTVLKSLMLKGETHIVRLKAAQMILDRAYGPVAVPKFGDGPEEELPPTSVSVKAVDASVNEDQV